jgi:hypothetical protein
LELKLKPKNEQLKNGFGLRPLLGVIASGRRFAASAYVTASGRLLEVILISLEFNFIRGNFPDGTLSMSWWNTLYKNRLLRGYNIIQILPSKDFPELRY